MSLRPNELIQLGKDIGKEINEDDVGGLAADMAYHFVMALFPFLLFLVALTSFIEPVFGVDNLEQKIVDEVAKVAPPDVTSTVETLVSNVLNNQSAGLLSIGLVLAIWSASGAMQTVMKAINRAYDVEEGRGFIPKRALAIGLTVLTAVFFIFATGLIIGGQFVSELVSDSLGVGGAGEVLWMIARFVGVLALVGLAIAFIYWKAPAKDQRWVWVSPGAIFFVVAWIIATVGFSFYIANFGSYNETYGTIGAAIIALLWFYITSFLIVLGAEINAVLEKRLSPQTAKQGAEPETVPATRDRRSLAASPQR
jgi:membrane protein